MSRPRSEKIYGVGINDHSDTVFYIDHRGKRVKRPCYERWKNMLERCYSEKTQARQPRYIGCSVDERWHSFSNFREWMLNQDWEGKDLDKDLLVSGNKVYGPDTCIFIDTRVNRLMGRDSLKPGKLTPVGVTYYKSVGAYEARIYTLDGKSKRLGKFDNVQDALNVYTKAKKELYTTLAHQQNDPRVKNALLERCK